MTLFALLFRWLVLALAVWVATTMVPGIRCDNAAALWIAALVLGILNSFVKPVLVLISLPFVVISLGLFLLVINALLLWVTSRLVAGFYVEGFWSALGASLIISVISLFLGQTGRRRRRMVYRRWEPPEAAPRGPPPGKGPIIDV
jgi:putative membrane protein